MWFVNMWPLEPLQPFWGHEGRHQCHILGVKAQRTPGSWVVAPNLELPCLDLLVIVKESESENYVTRSCPTLCDPIDSSPPSSPVPGILQARTLEWVAISFSNAWKWKVKVKLLSRVRLLATPWIAAYQAPPSMGFSRQEYWSRVPLPSPLLG